jgi:carbamoylphosphate synthase large subunit
VNKLNILITTVGGLTSPDILSAFRNNQERDVFIVGTDPFEFAVGRKFVDVFKVLPNSDNNQQRFADEISKLVADYQIDVVVPCGNEDGLALSRYKSQIQCKVMVGEYRDLIQAYDKGYVYQRLQKELKENSPRFFIVSNYDSFMEAIDSLGFPQKKIVVKPRFGRGGRGVYTLSGDCDFDVVFSSKPDNNYPLDFFEKILKNKQSFDDLIVMEYLDEPYYSLYSICKNGNNLFTLKHTRKWGTASQMLRGEVSYDKKMEAIATKVIKIFNLNYTNNIELGISEEGRVVLFDLNPRIGASSAIDCDLGFNFPYQALKLLIEEDIEITNDGFNTKHTFIRYFKHMWL